MINALDVCEGLSRGGGGRVDFSEARRACAEYTPTQDRAEVRQAPRRSRCHGGVRRVARRAGRELQALRSRPGSTDREDEEGRGLGRRLRQGVRASRVHRAGHGIRTRARADVLWCTSDARHAAPIFAILPLPPSAATSKRVAAVQSFVSPGGCSSCCDATDWFQRTLRTRPAVLVPI
jgi:hypothetical protein